MPTRDWECSSSDIASILWETKVYGFRGEYGRKAET